MNDCIFCRIVKGQIPSKKVYEDDQTYAFEDLDPKAPTHVQLWFNEEIESAYASLTVLDAGKNPVTAVKPQLASNDLKSIVLPLPELAPGKYSVKFRVLSLDGHVIQSSFDFTVKGNRQEK